jgi:hypothetical protein
VTDRLPEIKRWRKQWDRTAHTDGVAEQCCALNADWLITEVERLRKGEDTRWEIINSWRAKCENLEVRLAYAELRSDDAAAAD